VKFLARYTGEGWLRAEGFGSSTAAYEFTVQRHNAGPDFGKLVTDGRMLSELPTMIEASMRRWATLILANGKSVRIDVVSVSSNGMCFTVREPIPDLPA